MLSNRFVPIYTFKDSNTPKIFDVTITPLPDFNKNPNKSVTKKRKTQKLQQDNKTSHQFSYLIDFSLVEARFVIKFCIAKMIFEKIYF